MSNYLTDVLLHIYKIVLFTFEALIKPIIE